MSPSTPQTCPHDRGRGTTVCLRCRHDQLKAERLRRQRFLMQFLGIAAVIAIVGVAGVGAASTLRGAKEAAVSTSEGTLVAETRPAKPVPEPAKSTAVLPQLASPANAPVSPPPATSSVRPAPRGGFVLVEGKTQLTDSVYATRTGDSVVVNFDAYGYRTRRSSKLETSLRETFPMVFGKSATASFDTATAGSLVANRDVVGALATEGMRFTLDNGTTVRVKVLTRLVSDGPIAIGYLAIIER